VAARYTVLFNRLRHRDKCEETQWLAGGYSYARAKDNSLFTTFNSDAKLKLLEVDVQDFRARHIFLLMILGDVTFTNVNFKRLEGGTKIANEIPKAVPVTHVSESGEFLTGPALIVG
jgi:hypothetical protein